jgi:hypothetical protein
MATDPVSDQRAIVRVPDRTPALLASLARRTLATFKAAESGLAKPRQLIVSTDGSAPFRTIGAALAGVDARRVAEQLIAWAEDKERRVAESDRKGVTLTRLPCSKSFVPEMWFHIDYPGERLPMYTISVKGTGRVVVQFQWMLYPPFDTDDGRASLLTQLDAIEGVAISPDRLRGRPDFGIEALTSPSAMARLIDVLERIVDETVPTRSLPTPDDTAIDDPGVGTAPA